MVGPIRFDGLASGIDFTSIIEKLLSIQQRPIINLQNRIAEETDRKTALLKVSANLLGIRSATLQLQKPSFLNRTTATSSNTNVLTASGDQIGVTGAFTFTVERLAQTHQLVSNGFADDDDVITATDKSITVEVGNGFLDRQTPLAFLNGGLGVDRGLIQVTDSSGDTAVIDLQGAANVQDVLDRINNNTAISVEARALSDRLVVRDEAGGAGTLSITNFGLDTTATDLGLAKTRTTVGGTQFIFGNDVNFVTTATDLRFINDGRGVRRNADGSSDFTIATASGASISVDIQASDVTLGNVITRINNAAAAAGSTLVASINDDASGLRLTTAGGAGAASVTAAADSLAAVDLGLGRVSGVTFVGITARLAATGSSAANGAIFQGNRIVGGLNSILRGTLNGGQARTIAGDIGGARDGSLTITDKSGSSVTLNLDAQSSSTLTAGAAVGASSASLASVDGFAVGNKIRFTGGTGGATDTRTIVRISGTTVVFDRVLTNAFDADDKAYAVNESLGDIVNNINFRTESAAVDVSVRINDAGNGLLARDISGGAGPMTITGAGGFVVADLGISGTTAGTLLDGSDLDPQYLSENTLLATLNSGKGVQPGKFRVTDTNGTVFDVDLAQPTDTSIGRVISDFNGAAVGASSNVRARLNNTGDGIILSSSSLGAGTLRVSELGSTTTAKDLNILGSAPAATPGTINGTFERTVTITAGTKVKDVAARLNEAGVGVQAALLNDGGIINPFKLTLLSRTAGTPGRLTIDTDISGLAFTTTTGAQDAILLYGTDQGATDPLLITSTSNRFKDIVPGLTVDLKSVSASPVTVTVDRDTQAVVDQVSEFVEKYNATIKTIRDLTQFNSETNETGLLFSESVIRTVRRDLGTLVTQPVNQIPNGEIRSFSQLGVKVASNGQLSFDSSALTSALQTDFDGVTNFFTLQKPLKIDTALKDLNNGLGVSNVLGVDDFRVVKRNGDFFDINLDGVTTLGSVLNAINNDPGNGGNIVATISPDGFSLRLLDSSALGRTADAGGSATTLVESSLISSPISFIGARIAITSGPDTGQTRFVTAFDSATGTLTLDSALSGAPDGQTYNLDRALQVMGINNSLGASDLRIAKSALLGDNLLNGDLINLSGDPGKGFSISEKLDFLTRTGDGLISTRTDGIDDTIEGFNASIERLAEKIAKEEERLVREFARLEQLIASSQQTMSQLAAQQSGLLSLAGGLKR